jgi:glycosyltransferase involved in cell wall biosynthesis
MQQITIDPMVFAVDRPCGISRLWSSLIDGFRRERLDFEFAGNKGVPLPIRRHLPCRHRGQLYVPTLLSPTFNNHKNVQIVHDCIKERTYPTTKASLIKLRRKWLFNRATRLICVSEATKHDVGAIYGSAIANKATVIYNIIDADRIRRLASQGRVPRHIANQTASYTVGMYIGTRNNTKNFPECLTLFRADPNVRLVIVGPPPTSEEKLAYREFGNRMIFAGPLSDEDMFASLAASDFLFMPSTLEGFGMTLGESLSLGTPSLGLKTRINLEVSGGTMFTFESGDARSLGETLTRLQIAKRIESNVQERVLQRYSPDAVVKRYISTFAQACAS